MIKYGLISETDARTLEKTIDLIFEGFPELREGNDLASFGNETKAIKITEVGLFDCGTAKGICSYISTKASWLYIGIDNERHKQIDAPNWINFIKGNSNEVYNQLKDESQHLIFIDGLHTFAGVISDFFCYAPKVKVGGYLAFHDTGKHINPLHGWQRVGDKNDPDMCLGGVRKALDKIGILGSWMKFEDRADIWAEPINNQWQLIFDEADINDEAGGICVFKKLY